MQGTGKREHGHKTKHRKFWRGMGENGCLEVDQTLEHVEPAYIKGLDEITFRQ